VRCLVVNFVSFQKIGHPSLDCKTEPVWSLLCLVHPRKPRSRRLHEGEYLNSLPPLVIMIVMM